jgi:branched-chain amino acid transport system substrate-binding protein
MILASALVGLLLQGCASKPKPIPVPTPAEASQKTPTASKVHKIGLLLPLTGEHGALGKALAQAAELSLFEHGEDNIELLVEDTKATKEGGEKAAALALDQGAQILLGPVFSEAVTGASLVATRAHMPLIAFSNNKSVARAGVYTLGFDPGQQIERVVRFASEKGLKRITAYLPQSPDGHLTQEVLARLQKEGVSNVVKTVFYDPASPGTLSVNTPPSTQAILMPEGGQALSRIVSALLYHDHSADKYRLLGSGQWDSPGTWSDPHLVGGWFAAPTPGGRATFEKVFLETYGYKPPRLATLSYDAVSLVSALVKKFPQKSFERTSLERPQGFMGIDGAFRLRASGHVERSLALLEVQPHLFQVVDPAPRMFER